MEGYEMNERLMDWTASSISRLDGSSDTMRKQDEFKKCCFKQECCTSSSLFKQGKRRRTLFISPSTSSILACCKLCRQGVESSCSPSAWDCNSGPGRPKTMPLLLAVTSTATTATAKTANSQSSKWSRSLLSPLLFSVILITCSSAFLNFSDACSSRSAPRPRFSAPTSRPNITFQTYACPEAYARWYCLNGATCFSVRIGESILYNCECADGFMGQRCEFKDLDGSYLPSRERLSVAQAGVCGGVLMALAFSGLFIVILKRRKERSRIRASSEMALEKEVNFGIHVGGRGHCRSKEGSATIAEERITTVGSMVPSSPRNFIVCETSIIDMEKGMTGYVGLNWAVKSGRRSRQTSSPTNIKNGLELILTTSNFRASSHHRLAEKVAHCPKREGEDESKTVLEQLDPDSGRDGVLLFPTNQPICGQWMGEESHAVQNNMDSLGNNLKNGPGAT